jgi:hypothetical protein
VLQDRISKEVLHLSDEGPKRKSILVIKTSKISDMPNKKQIKTIAENIMKGNQSAMLSTIYDDQQEDDSPSINEKQK